MPAEGSNDDAQAIGRARNELNGALDVMRDNMRVMAERDSQLHDLQGKSTSLHSVSGAFSQQAIRLRKEKQWQRCKTYLTFALLACAVAWLIAFYLLSGQRFFFAEISAAVFAVIAPLSWCLIKRWRGNDDQSAYHDASQDIPLD